MEEGDEEKKLKKILIKIPKKEELREKSHSKKFASDRTKSTLIGALVARLWRMKAAYLELKDPSLQIPQIYYPYPIVYEILDDDF